MAVGVRAVVLCAAMVKLITHCTPTVTVTEACVFSLKLDSQVV